MTIAKRIDRKKRNRKLFNKLMAFYFALVSCSAFGFLTAFADSEYSLKGKNVSVLENVEVCTGLRNAFRGIGYFFLRILAEIVSDFEKAVDILLKLNLYDLIDKYFKIDTWGKNIAAAVCALALVFVAVLLIFNADKTRLTDFGRGIIISVSLIIALPVLIRALGQLQTIGVDESKSLVGQEQEYVTDDGQVGKMTLGELLLCNNVVDVEESVSANKLVYCSELKGFRNNSGKILTLDYNRVSTSIKEKPEKVVSKVQPQNKFSDLDEKAKVTLCGGTAEELYNQWKDGYNAAKDNYEKYKNKSDEDKTKDGYHPHTLPRKLWTNDANGNSVIEVYVYLKEETSQKYAEFAVLSGGEKIEYVENGISECMVGGAIDILHNAGIYKYDKETARNSTGWGYNELANLYRDAINNRLDGVEETIKKMENIKIKVGDYDFSVMEWLNISNNRELYINAESLKDKSSQFTIIEDLERPVPSDIPGWIDYAWRSVVTWGHADEYVYKYNFNFLRGAFELIVVAICLLFAGLKVASTLFDIIFARLIAPIVIASDMHGSGRAKQMVQNLISSYLILITIVLLLRIYIMVLFAIKKDGSAIGNNLAAELMIMLGGAKFVIDGPDIIVKILGIDAGVKSGLGTVMGIRTAAGMARGAAHTASSIAHTPSNIAGKVGGSVGSRVEAYRNSRDSGHSTARAVVSGITNGGLSNTSAGRAFTESRNQSYSRNANTASRTRDGQNIYSHNANSNAGGHGGNNGNNADTGGTGGTGGHSGGAGGNTTIIAGGKGEKGDTGAKGDKGDKGDRGDMGMQGRQGEKGDKGQDANQTNQTGDWGRDEYRREKTEGTAFKD